MKQNAPIQNEQNVSGQSSSFQEQVVELKSLLKQEREIGVRILEILGEIDREKKYLVEGYSSLFAFCTEALGMSESQAHTRIVCLREMKQFPSLKQEIEAGTIKPTQVVELVKSIKQASRPVTPAFKQELIESLKHRTKEETKAVLIEKLELPKTHKLILELSPELKQRLDHLKQACSHRFQSGSNEEVLGFLLGLAEKHLPQMKRGNREGLSTKENSGLSFQAETLMGTNQKAETNLKADSLETFSLPPKQTPGIHDAQPVFTSPAQGMVRQGQAQTATNSRYIPASIKNFVLTRSKHQCEYHNPTTHHRCSNTHYLQFDHITPYSKQGPSNDPKNIQLLCSAHNQWKGTRALKFKI